MPFAAIFVPDFSVEAVLRAEPDLRSPAVAVLEGKAPQQRVCALNEKARVMGLDVGMTKLQSETCSELVLRNRSTLQESAAHAALLDCAQSFSPRVEDTATDLLVLDIAGMEPLFGTSAKLARDLARRASDLGLEVNVAVAANPDAATLAARGFPGITVIPFGSEEERLADLPIPTLLAAFQAKGSEPDTNQLLDTLERWGIRKLRALAALPEIAISERLGQKGVQLQRLARGAVSRTLVPVDPPLNFEEAVELEYPLVLLEPLAFLLNQMLEQLCSRLSARALATQELRLRFQLETGVHADEESTGNGSVRPVELRTGSDGGNARSSLFTRTLRLPIPMLDAKIFLKLLQLDLNAHPPGAPIRKIWLTAEPARSRAAQGGLFTPPLPEPEKLELTLARISGIVGEGRVGSLEILDTHRPEAFRMQAFNPAASEQKKVSEDYEPKSLVTALRIFRPPLRATVIFRDGCPARIACEKKKDVQGEIIWQAGPWRSSGDWWETNPWSRDEWDIALQTATGIALYRLVHDLLGGRWFVEGTYD
jgi:protein ImuB